METLTSEAPQQAEAGHPHRTGLLVLVAVLTVAGIAVATWAVNAANQSDGLAIVTEYADAADVAWVTGDGDALAAFYAVDGVWDCPMGRREGRDAISAYISTAGNFEEVRHGDITKVEDGVFMYPAEADTWAFEVWVTLEDDLISHTALTGWRSVNCAASRTHPSAHTGGYQEIIGRDLLAGEPTMSDRSSGRLLIWASSWSRASIRP